MIKEKIDDVVASMERLDDEHIEVMNKMAVLFDAVKSLEFENNRMENLIYDMGHFIASLDYPNDKDDMRAVALIDRAETMGINMWKLRA